MVEIQPDLAALMRFRKVQGLMGHDDEDLGYAVHAWLAAAFGQAAPKPWRLLLDRRRPPRLLAYSTVDAEALQNHLRAFAEPATFAVCPDPQVAILSKQLPRWRAGRRLAFEVLCCPVGRKSATGIEKDVFLLRADTAPPGSLHRDEVYGEWARRQIEQTGAASVASVRLDGFRLVRLMRQTREAGGTRRARRLVRPQALLRGELIIRNADGFTELLRRGIGRHRSFGYGMLLLGPAS